MGRKAQHTLAYTRYRDFLRDLRVKAELSQRDLGAILGKPQSWVHNCETGSRRVDIPEFIAWCTACGVDPIKALARFMGR